MKALVKDFRYCLRSYSRRPLFAVTIIGTLALGIGANTAVFSIADTVMFRSLPFPNPDRLVAVWNKFPSIGFDELPASGPEFFDYRDNVESLKGLSAFYGADATLTGGEQPERISAAVVSPSLFEILGTGFKVGRGFAAEEATPGHDKVAVLSHGLWQHYFSSDPGILGKVTQINGDSYTVVGVAEEGFDFPESAELWLPLAFDAANPGARGNHYLSLVARLADGSSLERAQTEVSTIAARLQREYPDNYPPDSGWGATVISLHEEIVGNVRATLWALLGAVAFVLLIACTNVANLLLARLQGREKELSIRVAMGAGRLQLFRQFMTESVVLTLSGSMLGLALAYWSTTALVRANLIDLPRVDEIGLDGRILLFTLGLSALTAVLFGLIPVLKPAKRSLAESLRDTSGRSTAGTQGRLAQASLVVIEIAVAFTLLIGSGLMIKSFVHLLDVKPGFNPEKTLTYRISLPSSKYGTTHEVTNFYASQLENLSRLPWVEEIGMTSHLPLSNVLWSRSFTPQGYQPTSSQMPPDAYHHVVTPGYFAAMGIPLVEGRVFNDADREDSAGVAVVDEALAQRYWPNENAVGKQLKIGEHDSDYPWLVVIGVVGHVKSESLESSDSKGQLYFPYLQYARRGMYTVLRTSREDPKSLLGEIRGVIRQMDSELPLYKVSTLEDSMASSVSRKRFTMMLMTLFAAVGLALGAIGIYGVMAFTVNQRTQEIAIRQAFGAVRLDILRLILSRGMALALTGMALGVTLSFIASRLLSGLLYQVSATDGVTFAGVAFVLACVTLMANLVPARKAMAVEPMITLRSE